MFKSKSIGKTYKTKTALKTQLKKVESKALKELAEVKECKKQGWKFYLGDPINLRLRHLVNFILEINEDRKNNNLPFVASNFDLSTKLRK